MIRPDEVLETIEMIERENLDIRTITMGISLRDCASESGKRSCEKIYEKITRLAGSLVKTAENIQTEFGIPIINKRISVTPIALVAESSDEQNYTAFAKALDRAAAETGIDFIGGFSALVHKGYTSGDHKLIDSIPEALASTKKVCSSEQKDVEVLRKSISKRFTCSYPVIGFNVGLHKLIIQNTLGEG